MAAADGGPSFRENGSRIDGGAQALEGHARQRHWLLRAIANFFEYVLNVLWRAFYWLVRAARPIDELEALQRDSIARRFEKDYVNIKEATRQGTKDGALHVPPSESRTLVDSSYLARIYSAATSAATQVADRYSREFTGRVLHLQRSLPPLDVDIQNVVNQAVNVDIAGARLECEDRIVKSYKAAAKAKSKFLGWALRQGLDRTEPDHVDLLRSGFVIAIFLSIETVLNGTTLNDASSNGWRGALVASLAISAVNVGAGLVLGFSFGRLRNHVNWCLKVFGWVGSAGCLCLAVAAHLALAAARYGMIVQGMSMEDAFVQAGTILHTDYADMATDLKNWALVGIGLACWAWSFYEGQIAFADPYPGMSRQYARVRRAEIAAESAQENFEDRLRGIEADAGDELADVAADAKRDVDSKKHSLSVYVRLGKLMGSEIGGLDISMQRILFAYTAANAACRGECLAPSWFGRPANLFSGVPFPNSDPGIFDSLIVEGIERARRTEAAKIKAQEDIALARRDAIAHVNEARRAELGRPAAPEGTAGPLPPVSPSQLRRGFGGTIG